MSLALSEGGRLTADGRRRLGEAHRFLSVVSCRRAAGVALLLALLAAAGAAPAQAQEAGAFARLGFGARGIALGNALVADVSGRASPFYNPALAPFASRQHLSAAVGLLSFDREVQYLHFATPIRPRAGLAVGLTHAATNDVDGRDNSGYHTETFSVDEYAFFLAFGTRFSERVAAGLALRLYRTDLADLVDAQRSLGVGLGLTARLSRRLHLGLAVSDLLARYAWNTSDLYGTSGRTVTDRFPVRLRLGLSYARLRGRLRLLAEAEGRLTARQAATGAAETTARSRFRVGGTYAPLDVLRLHAGLDRLGARPAESARPSAGFSLDPSLGQLKGRVSYAFVYEAGAATTMHVVALLLFL